MSRWLAPLLWMALIFFASTGAGSAQNTSRLIGPFLRWLLGAVSDQTVWQIQFYLRKSGHAVGYAILATLCWRALAQPAGWLRGEWRSKEGRLAWLIASVYAITDELHQSFIPSRQGSLLDVLLDATGAALGLLLVRALCLRKKADGQFPGQVSK